MINKKELYENNRYYLGVYSRKCKELCDLIRPRNRNRLIYFLLDYYMTHDDNATARIIYKKLNMHRNTLDYQINLYVILGLLDLVSDENGTRYAIPTYTTELFDEANSRAKQLLGAGASFSNWNRTVIINALGKEAEQGFNFSLID